MKTVTVQSAELKRIKSIIKHNLEQVGKAIQTKSHKDDIGHGYNIGERDAYKRILKEFRSYDE